MRILAKDPATCSLRILQKRSTKPGPAHIARTQQRLNMMRLALLFGVALATFAVSSGSIPYDCLKCICKVESHGCKVDVESGDGGRSCGPYQIQWRYWIDGGSLGRSYKDCCRTMWCSEDTVRAYMRRWATRSSVERDPTCKDFARIHNGGPNGHNKDSTLDYWAKVEKCLDGN